MKNKKYLIVVNPKARSKSKHYLKKLKHILSDNKFEYDIVYTEADTQLTESMIKNKLPQCSDVISIGGDGTLNMLCNVLAEKDIPLGILPCGTGNDVARHIYNDSDDIINTVINGNTMKIDLGWCNNRYFINVLGIGYDAMIVEKTKDDNKTFFRSLFYVWNALKYLALYKENKIRIKSDGFNKNEASFMVAFGNATSFAKGMYITPKADISDGLLDCCWIGKLSFIKKCYCLIKIFSGEHLSIKNVEYTQGKTFQILSENQPIEADGEFAGYTPATICIKEKALLLKVP